MIEPFTIYPETLWPAIPSPFAAGVLGVLYQLEQSQWWPADKLAAHQSRQLSVVLNHARATVPFYRDRLQSVQLSTADIVSSEAWLQIPRLTRRDIQLAGPTLHSTTVPKNHGNVSSTTTGGSTGQPVTVASTELADFFWRVLTLRDHVWHRRDFAQPFAAIRYADEHIGQPPTGARGPNWGEGAQNVMPTGPGFLLNIRSSIEEQAEWLRMVNPGYFLVYPSALSAIAKQFEERGWRLSQLRQVLTYGEVLEPECRSISQRAFGVPVVDVYSAQEVGYIALQCPDSEHYHVQSESVFVEVLNDDGSRCQPGQVGKVVISTLHNSAMPLIRYEIGDYAEVCEHCPCGRGLPVLKRVLGRQRNLLVMPNGERRWPVFVSDDGMRDLPPFFQFQVVQRTVDELDINVVRPGGPLNNDEHKTVERYFQRVLGYPFKITVTCVDAIPRSPTGKFEDFISLVAATCP